MSTTNEPIKRPRDAKGHFMKHPPATGPTIHTPQYPQAREAQDLPMGKMPDLAIPADGNPYMRPTEAILPVDKPLALDQAEMLAFAEEPVTIRIERSTEKNAPPCFPIFVNGRPAEVWDSTKQRWLPLGYLPVNQPITTKRKFVEVLLRSRTDNIETKVVERDNDNPLNLYIRTPTMRAGVQILHDSNPKSWQWLESMMAVAA